MNLWFRLGWAVFLRVCAGDSETQRTPIGANVFFNDQTQSQGDRNLGAVRNKAVVG